MCDLIMLCSAVILVKCIVRSGKWGTPQPCVILDQ